MRRLKILAPISQPDEVAMVLDAGATEIYGGVLPRAWTQRFSHAVWMSRRGPSANLDDFAALSQTVQTARDRGAGFHLALNASHWTLQQIDMVADLAEQSVKRLGVEAVIAADICLMTELGKRGVPFVASTVAVAHNADAFAMFADLGAVRGVLPRHMKLAEIERIATALPNLELEAFVLFDNCAYEEGLCRTQHDVGDTGAFCQTPWQYGPHRVDGAAMATAERADWDKALDGFREWLRWADACGHPLTDDKMPNGACGLCAIHDLRDAGVGVVKLAGREAGSYRKLRGVQLVARVVERLAAGASAADAATFATEIRDTPDLCASGAMCYYPEVVQLGAKGRWSRPAKRKQA